MTLAVFYPYHNPKGGILVNNEKKPYEKAEAEVVRFDNSDVITTSGEFDSGVHCYISFC